uniref:Cyclic nucleotide-binding domain-containing protein n=1 Tax=Eutreptiella gymnastica TaxID=73025 RepID=A0A7S1NVI0_9EUGL|mmetsp:Transcript_95291/g.164442  ORF Transcript_95291/g.164442 Transcript_95291/m.164442 type:complete len:1147 (+) Transcript_95291:42-3482(+)
MVGDSNESRSSLEILSYLDLDATTEQYLTVLNLFKFGINDLPKEVWNTEDECSEDDEPTMSDLPILEGEGRERRQEIHNAASQADNLTKLPFHAKGAHDTLRLVQYLLHDVLFAHMNAIEVGMVADAMAEVNIRADTVLYEQDAPSTDKSRLYIIMDGIVESYLNEELEEEIGPGMAFGRFCLMPGAFLCSSTIQTKTDVRAFSLRAKTYRRLCTYLMDKRVAHNLWCLSYTTWTKYMERNTLLKLVQGMDMRIFSPGEIMLHPQEMRHQPLIVLLEGQVSVMMHNEHTNQKTFLGKIRPPALIGEAEFLHGKGNGVLCCAESEVKALKLEPQHFELLVGPVEVWLRECMNTMPSHCNRDPEQRGACILARSLGNVPIVLQILHSMDGGAVQQVQPKSARHARVQQSHSGFYSSDGISASVASGSYRSIDSGSFDVGIPDRTLDTARTIAGMAPSIQEPKFQSPVGQSQLHIATHDQAPPMFHSNLGTSLWLGNRPSPELAAEAFNQAPQMEVIQGSLVQALAAQVASTQALIAYSQGLLIGRLRPGMALHNQGLLAPELTLQSRPRSLQEEVTLVRAQYGDLSGLAQHQACDPATPLTPAYVQYQPPLHAWQPLGLNPASLPALNTPLMDNLKGRLGSSSPSTPSSKGQAPNGFLQHASDPSATKLRCKPSPQALNVSHMQSPIGATDTSANLLAPHRSQTTGNKLPASAATPQRMPSPTAQSSSPQAPGPAACVSATTKQHIPNCQTTASTTSAGATTPQRTTRAPRTIPRISTPEGTGISRLVKRRQTSFVRYDPQDDDESDQEETIQAPPKCGPSPPTTGPTNSAPEHTLRPGPQSSAPEGLTASCIVKRRQTGFVRNLPEEGDESDDQEEVGHVRFCDNRLLSGKLLQRQHTSFVCTNAVSDSESDTDEVPPAVQRTTSVATVQKTMSMATMQRTTSTKVHRVVKPLNRRRPTGFVRKSDLPGYDSESEVDEDEDPAARRQVKVGWAGQKDCTEGTDSQGDLKVSVQSQGNDMGDSEDEAGPTPETTSSPETISNDEDQRVPVYMMRERQDMRQVERNREMQLLGLEVDNLRKQLESAQPAMNGTPADTNAEPACSVATGPCRTPQIQNSAILTRGQSQRQGLSRPIGQPGHRRRESIFSS